MAAAPADRAPQCGDLPPGYPFGEARLLHVSSELYTQSNPPELAREPLAAALAIFRRLGARWDVGRAEHTLVSPG